MQEDDSKSLQLPSIQRMKRACITASPEVAAMVLGPLAESFVASIIDLGSQIVFDIARDGKPSALHLSSLRRCYAHISKFPEWSRRPFTKVLNRWNRAYCAAKFAIQITEWDEVSLCGG